MEFRNTAPLAWIRMTWSRVVDTVSTHRAQPATYRKNSGRILLPNPVTELGWKLRPALAVGSLHKGGGCSYLRT